jgi:hypothetical protein
MKSMFSDLAIWLSSVATGSAETDHQGEKSLSRYDRQVRELELQSGKMFLP